MSENSDMSQFQMLGRCRRRSEIAAVVDDVMSMEKAIAARIAARLREPEKLPVLIIHDETTLATGEAVKYFKDTPNAIVVFPPSKPVVGYSLLPCQSEHLKRMLDKLDKGGNCDNISS